jgi:hypothetical protein
MSLRGGVRAIFVYCISPLVRGFSCIFPPVHVLHIVAFGP